MLLLSRRVSVLRYNASALRKKKAAKCGTGALAYFLHFHPDLVRSDVKEIYYFNRNYAKGEDWYLQQMPYAKPGEGSGIEEWNKIFFYKFFNYL